MLGKRNAGRTRVRVALGAVLLAGVLATAATPAVASPSLGAWNADASGLGVQTGVSCPSSGLCVSVVGMNANVSTAPSTAGTWQPQATGATGALNAVSCAPGSTFCVAVGAAGAVVVNLDAGGTSSSWTHSTQDGGHALTSVSCPSTSFCFAVDSSGGGAIYSTDSGTSWKPATPGHSFTAAACTGPSLCAAVDATGHIYVSGTPESGGWNLEAVDANANLNSVACGTTNGICVAVDGSGYVWATQNASTWSSTHIASSLSAVTCTPSAVCVAAGTGTAYASDDPTSGNPSWASSSLAASPPTGVACADQGLCAAVDGAGSAYVATLPAPSAGTGSATSVSQTTATLNATVNPNDAALTNCYFEYGTDTSYGSTVPCSSTPSPTGGPQSVSAQVSGLSAATTYHFQLVAASAIGSSGGGDQTFATAAPLRPSPAIIGTAAVGNTLTCSLGVTLPAGASASYGWVRDTTPIAGATGVTYVVAVADETHHLYCSATISGDGGSASANSGYIAVPSETLGTIFETTVGTPTSSARTVSIVITCSPQAVSACAVTLTLTTLGRHPHRLGTKTARIAPGAKATVSVALDSGARATLARTHRLTAELTVTGTIVGVIKGTLKRQKITFTTGRHARRH